MHGATIKMIILLYFFQSTLVIDYPIDTMLQMIILLFIHQIHYDMFRPVVEVIIGQHYPMMAPAAVRNM